MEGLGVSPQACIPVKYAIFLRKIRFAIVFIAIFLGVAAGIVENSDLFSIEDFD
jgi:hypothetical protein